MLEGEISQIHLIDRFVELWGERFTGAIRFENDGIIKIIYFKGGDILSASTNDRADSIDEILMRAGKVSREHVKQALAKRKENETLGDALLNLGFITRKELTWARRVQVVGVIRSIDAWTNGSFTIVSDYLPKRDEGTLFQLPQILIELTVTDPDRQKFERLLDGGEAIFAKAAEFDDQFPKLGLNEDADAIANAIDGFTTAAGVADASGRDPFNVYRLLHALATLRLLTRVETVPTEPQVSVEEMPAGAVADASDVWEEPAPVQPRFEFDEAEAARQPTLQVAIDTSMLPSYPGGSPPAEEPEPASTSAWDTPEEEPEQEAEPALAAPGMPAWDQPSREVAAVPIPAAVEPAAQAEEEQWGFDEAQIETAKRAATRSEKAAKTAARVPAPAKGRRGLVIGLVAVLAVALLGAGGWFTWQRMQQAVENPAPSGAVAQPEPDPSPTAGTSTAMQTADGTTTRSTGGKPLVVAAVPEWVTPTPKSSSSATTTTSATTTLATTTAPAVTATSAPVPAAAAPKPAPVSRPAATPPSGSPDRARYDAMARQNLASASGSDTVQIQILCDVGNLQNVLSAGGAEVWFVPQPIGARSCYRVLWGKYDSREEAVTALANIPAGLRDASAAVKPVPKP